jgi:hypothetical protein
MEQERKKKGEGKEGECDEIADGTKCRYLVDGLPMPFC